jgi:response regulator of citrate/malate metabolism
VDSLYHLLRGPTSPAGVRRYLSPTAQKVLELIRASDQPLGAAPIAEQLGVSRPTIQRYLAKLERHGLIELHLDYGATGRPNHRYRPTGRQPA